MNDHPLASVEGGPQKKCPIAASQDDFPIWGKSIVIDRPPGSENMPACWWLNSIPVRSTEAQIMKNLVTCISVGVVGVWATFGTPQEPERIVYGNKFCELHSSPLEQYDWEGRRRPGFQPSPRVVMTTGNWRGYVGLWEIAHGKLCLRGIDGWLRVEEETSDSVTPLLKRADLSEIFPNRISDGRVFASWYTGTLIPEVRRPYYGFDRDFDGVSGREIRIEVERGIVLRKLTIEPELVQANKTEAEFKYPLLSR